MWGASIRVMVRLLTCRTVALLVRWLTLTCGRGVLVGKATATWLRCGLKLVSAVGLRVLGGAFRRLNWLSFVLFLV